MKIFFVRHAVTQINIDNTAYINNNHQITKHGKLQALETGKYLKTFGKFDLIISSHRLRTIMTAEIIAKELNYKKEIIFDKLIAEEISKLCKDNPDCLISFEKIIEIIKNNATKSQTDQYNKYKKLIELSKDPFEIFKLKEKQIDLLTEIKGNTSKEILKKKAKKFLNKLKSYNYNNILVVTHGGVINTIQSIITNTNTNIVYESNKDIKYYGNYNCCIMGMLFEKNIKKFTLVIPSNILHLVKLINKSSESYPPKLL